MRLMIATLLMFSLTLSVFGQERLTLVVKGESTLEGLLPRDMLYAFENFRVSDIIRENDQVPGVRLNINLYTGDILFLTTSNQLLVMDDPEEILRIVIDEEIWLPIEQGYGEVFYAGDDISLVKYKSTRIADVRREAAFGGMTSTASTTSVTAFTPDNRGHVALPVGEYDFETRTVYKIYDGKKMNNADARGFRRAMGISRRDLNNYLDENPVDFDDKDDLIRLTKAIGEM